MMHVIYFLIGIAMTQFLIKRRPFIDIEPALSVIGWPLILFKYRRLIFTRVNPFDNSGHIFSKALSNDEIKLMYKAVSNG